MNNKGWRGEETHKKRKPQRDFHMGFGDGNYRMFHRESFLDVFMQPLCGPTTETHGNG